jgi:hypothetical protein
MFTGGEARERTIDDGHGPVRRKPPPQLNFLLITRHFASALDGACQLVAEPFATARAARESFVTHL